MKNRTPSEKSRENSVRRRAAQEGYIIKKSRTKTTFPLNGRSYGGYMVIKDGCIVAGEKFDMYLEDLEKWFPKKPLRKKKKALSY